MVVYNALAQREADTRSGIIVSVVQSLKDCEDFVGVLLVESYTIVTE